MNHLAIKLARKNNQLLDEYQTFIASDHRLLTYKIDKTLEKSAYQPDYVENGISPGPMSKITSDSRVRGRGFISKIRVRGIARVRGDSSKASGSDS